MDRSKLFTRSGKEAPYTGSSYTWSNTQKFSCGLQIPNSTRYACDRGNHRWSPKVTHGISTGSTAGVLNGHQ